MKHYGLRPLILIRALFLINPPHLNVFFLFPETKRAFLQGLILKVMHQDQTAHNNLIAQNCKKYI